MAAPSIRVDTRKAIHNIRREFRDLTEKELSLGVARALNRMANSARSKAIKDLRGRYKFKIRDLKATGKRRAGIRLQKATRKHLTSMIVASGAPLDLRAFQPRQTKRGVTVNIMNQRRLIRGAFIATMPSDYTGVFARGKYGSGGFQFRSKPGPKAGYKKGKGYTDLGISKMVGVSVPAAFGQEPIIKALATVIERDFPKRLEHELSFIRLGKQTKTP